MIKVIKQNRAVAIFFAVATVIVVAILAMAAISIIRNQSRITHHRVSRIQGHYAAMAGINLALEGLRVGAVNWPMPVSFYRRCIRRNTGTCPAGVPVVVYDDNFPVSINNVVITVTARGQSGCTGLSAPPNNSTVCLESAVDYTFTP